VKTIKELIKLDEAKKASKKDLPPVLIMKRKSIRQFADGRKVALYYVEKINKYVTVPYDSDGALGISEEI
jgi:hypothetical protein